MGAWDSIRSTTDKLSWPLTAAGRSSYNMGRIAVTKANSVVMEKVVPIVYHYVADGEGREEIVRFTTIVLKNTAFYGGREFLKWTTGPVYKIVEQSLRDAKTADCEEVKMKIDHYVDEVPKLQVRIDRLERILSSGGGGGLENIGDNVKFERECSVGKNNLADLKFESRVVPCLHSNVHLEPHDMIRIFMMKEFYGRFMFDNLLVPGVNKLRKDPFMLSFMEVSGVSS